MPQVTRLYREQYDGVSQPDKSDVIAIDLLALLSSPSFVGNEAFDLFSKFQNFFFNSDRGQMTNTLYHIAYYGRNKLECLSLASPSSIV